MEEGEIEGGALAIDATQAMRGRRTGGSGWLPRDVEGDRRAVKTPNTPIPEQGGTRDENSRAPAAMGRDTARDQGEK